MNNTAKELGSFVFRMMITGFVLGCIVRGLIWLNSYHVDVRTRIGGKHQYRIELDVTYGWTSVYYNVYVIETANIDSVISTVYAEGNEYVKEHKILTQCKQ